MVDRNGIAEIHDFGIDPNPRAFTLYTNDTNVFFAPPVLPLQLAAHATSLLKGMDSGDSAYEKVLALFDELLLPESATMMRQYAEDRTRPLGVQHVMKVMTWLLEGYGLRPTVPSPSSSIPSEGGGSTSSTDGASPEDSIPSNSDSIVS